MSFLPRQVYYFGRRDSERDQSRVSGVRRHLLEQLEGTGGWVLRLQSWSARALGKLHRVVSDCVDLALTRRARAEEIPHLDDLIRN